MKKQGRDPWAVPFYELSAEILDLYKKRLLELPKKPFEKALLEGKGRAGIYLMYDRRGELWNVGKATDLQRRLREYRSLWRLHKIPDMVIGSRQIAFVEFPPQEWWPRGLHKKTLYRIEWFVQMALEIPGSMNSLYRGDPALFRGKS